MQYPMLYQEGPQNLLFRWSRLLGWMLHGVCSAVIIFFLTIASLKHQAFRSGGEVIDLSTLGATAYTCIVWAVNMQMMITANYFTLIQHISIWAGIVLWYALQNHHCSKHRSLVIINKLTDTLTLLAAGMCFF
jgi:phospholipid-translocating ATPase